MRIVRNVVISAVALIVATTVSAASSKGEAKRLSEAATAVTQIRNADNGIPTEIWDKAQCVVVIPGLKKAGFIIGGEFGSGVMSCRQGNTWSAPAFMSLTKGSAGLQIGAEAIDLVLLVMNRSGAEKLLGNNVSLGADASIAAGPVGRTGSAATDAQMSAEMLSYSRSKGLFAGIDLSGGALKPDKSANAREYGRDVSARDIVLGTTAAPKSAEARAFTDALQRNVAATSGVK
jgi:lipid-binding SYLF domain-containing protein